MGPPTYKTQLLAAHKDRNQSAVRKWPYPVEKPTGPVRKRPYPVEKPTGPIKRKAVPPTNRKAIPSQAKTVPSKSVVATGNTAINTSKPVDKPKEDVKTAFERSKMVVDLMDFDDDLDIKGLREEPASEGHYELNPLMSRVLEKELQAIMIKVWQDLPDKPPTAAEKAVVDKLRTEAGDDLKNVLGLNVSKRLLNIHNPLYVKVSVPRKPDRESLKQFVQTYNCVGLKYAPSQPQHLYTFVAQFGHFADFDRICTAKLVKCGKEKVNIVPCYKFTTCPPHLKSIYCDKNSQNLQNTEESQINTYKTADSAGDNKGGLNVKAEKTVNKNTTTKITNSDQIKNENDTKVNKETKTESNAKAIVSKVGENKVESQASKSNVNQVKKAEITPTKINEKPQPIKASPSAQQGAKMQPRTMTAAKTQSGNVSTAKPQSGNVTPAKPQSGNATPAKPQSVNATSAKPQTGNATPAKPQSGNATPAKPQSVNATSAKPQTGNATPAKPQSGNATPAKPQSGNATSAKPQTGNATPAKPQTVNATPAKPQTVNATSAKPQTGNATPTKPQSEQDKTSSAVKTQQEKTTSAKTEPQKTTTKAPEKVQPQKPNPTKAAQTPTPQKASNAKVTPKVVANPNANKKPIVKTQKGNAKKITEEDLTAKISEMIAIDEVYDDDEPGEGDDDVLDDEDILALMSGAVVLDECRGSDED